MVFSVTPFVLLSQAVQRNGAFGVPAGRLVASPTEAGVSV